MLILDRMLVGSIKFVLDKLASTVDQELNDDQVLRERLLEAQMRLEVGELSAEEFAELEKTILARLREIQERRGGGGLPEGMEITGIEAEFTADEVHAAPPRRRKARPAKRKRR